MKKIFKVIPIVFLLTLASCSNTRSRISIFLYDSKDTFIAELFNELKLQMEGTYDYEYSFAENSQTLQNEEIVKSIESKTKLLIVNAVDRLACGSIIKKAESKDLPTIFINKEPLLTDLLASKKAYYVGSDPEETGRIQGDLAGNLFGNSSSLNEIYDKNKDGKIQILMLKGEQGHQDTELRSRYSVQQLKDNNYKVDILSSSFDNWSKEEAFETMKTIYPEFGDQIELVLSNNDDMGIGVVNYLKTLESYDKSKTIIEQFFPIIGVDATFVGLDAIKKGDIYGTVKNDATKQATVTKVLSDYIVQGKAFSDFPYNFSNDRYIKIKGEAITIKDLVK